MSSNNEENKNEYDEYKSDENNENNEYKNDYYDEYKEEYNMYDDRYIDDTFDVRSILNDAEFPFETVFSSLLSYPNVYRNINSNATPYNSIYSNVYSNLYRNRNNYNTFLNIVNELENLVNSDDDDYERVLNESFQSQPVIERNKTPINFISQKYDTLKNENKECSICLVPYEINEMVTKTSCNHLFHTNCIEEWSRYKHDCPVCRKELN